MNLISICKSARECTKEIGSLSNLKRNQILKDISENLNSQESLILRANKKDLANNTRLPIEIRERLILNPKKLRNIITSINNIRKLNDPLLSNEEFTRNDGLVIKKQPVPIGVIAAIYESRPNVTIDIACLSIKSGNVAILRGGKESLNTNLSLTKIIKEALKKNNVSSNCIQYLKDPNRKYINEMLGMDEYIDLVIPRGGKELVNNVSRNAKMRAIFGGIGVSHLFIDEKIDEESLLPILENAKTQAPSVCNALDTILLHEKQQNKLLPKIINHFIGLGIEMRIQPKLFQKAKKINPSKLIKKASEKDWGQEYLNLIVSLKTVPSIESAIKHIDRHSYGHTDGIISNIIKNQKIFTEKVNSSAVTVNASTRFNDGGELGLGAEIAVSTTKVSPRGPLGLNEITSYKWIIVGKGHIRS